MTSLTHGDAVKCLSDNNKVYRYWGSYPNGKLRWYPNPHIASSWDANWETNIRQFDCGGIP